MDKLRIGIIGTGHIAVDHIMRMRDMKRVEFVAVSSRRREPAEKAAALCGARVEDSYEAVVNADDIDAVMVCSPSEIHEEHVLAALATGKYVFCEKPLAVTAEGCRRIMEAEARIGRRMVMVGFMRRFDRGYLQVKEAIAGGQYGAPLIVHCAHRNIEAHVAYTTDMAITQTAIHEIDISRWLLDDEYESAQIIYPPQSKNATSFRDPEIVIMKTKKGVIINLEIYISCHYGYDVQCEVVCEDGVVRMPQPSNLFVRADGGTHEALENDWVLRFDGAFDDELAAWVDGVMRDREAAAADPKAPSCIPGPTAWDGYAAAVTADALIKAQTSGQAEPITLGDKPALYT